MSGRICCVWYYWLEFKQFSSTKGILHKVFQVNDDKGKKCFNGQDLYYSEYSDYKINTKELMHISIMVCTKMNTKELMHSTARRINLSLDLDKPGINLDFPVRIRLVEVSMYFLSVPTS